MENYFNLFQLVMLIDNSTRYGPKWACYKTTEVLEKKVLYWTHIFAPPEDSNGKSK